MSPMRFAAQIDLHNFFAYRRQLERIERQQCVACAVF